MFINCQARNNRWAQEYSVVLVIPDFYDRCYVQNMCRILLQTMGFKQLCVQQVTHGCPLTGL